MKKLILFIFFFSCLLAGQAQVYKPISFPEKVDKRYIINPIKEEEKYRKKVAKKIPSKYLKDYTYNCTFGKADMFKGGKIYLSWDALENYVNNILDSIIPGPLRSKKIRAFIGRSSEINAYCLYDGTMIVNAGLLAEVKNEAALAVVMGHELAHHMKNHVLNSYVKSVKEKKKKKSGDAIDRAIQKQNFSQKNELEADDIGYGIAKEAGYDVSQASSTWELFIREKEYEKKRNGSDLVTADSVQVATKNGKYNANTLEKLLSSHPDEKERQDKLVEYLKKTPNIRKSTSKFNVDVFKALQKQSRLESLALIFAEHNYSECLERAFRFYLAAPEETTYHYYIAESIRRLCLLDYTMRKKGFLSDKIINDVFANNKGILHDLHFLLPNEEDFKNIKATEMLSKTAFPFENYKEAFYFFTKKLIKKDYSEAYLMEALFENNPQKRKASVDKYLTKNNALRKDFAKNYLNNTLQTSLNDNPGELVLVPKVDFYWHTRFTYAGIYGTTKYNFGKSELIGSEMADEISMALSNNVVNTNAISIPLASTQNFNTKEKYMDMITSTFLAQREENEGYTVQHYYKELEDEDYIGAVDIFRLNPEIWDFFRENKLHTISYARYVRHYSKYDNIFHRPALYFVPLGWLFLPVRSAQYKQLTLVTYDTNAEVPLMFSKIKNYRLSNKKAVKMYRKLRKEKEEFIKDNYKNS